MPKKGVSDLISCRWDVGYSSLYDDTQGEEQASNLDTKQRVASR